MTVPKTWKDYVDMGECANCGLAADLMGGVGSDSELLSGLGAREFKDKDGEHTVCCTCYELLKDKNKLSLRRCRIRYAADMLDEAALVEFFQTPLQEIATMERSRIVGTCAAVSCRQIAESMKKYARDVVDNLPRTDHYTALSLRNAEEKDGRIR